MISPWVDHPTTKAEFEACTEQNSPYLYQWVPACYGFAWVRQHLAPVVPSQALSFVSHPAHSDHFIVSNPEVQKWQLMEAGTWVKMLQGKKKKTTQVLTDHSPWRRWAGWSGQCSLEERRKRWPRCTRGSECCALSTSFSSSASGLRTSGTPSRMDLPKEMWCDHPGIIRKGFFFVFFAVGLSPLHFQNPPEAPVMSIALRFLALIMVMVSLPAVGR